MYIYIYIYIERERERERERIYKIMCIYNVYIHTHIYIIVNTSNKLANHIVLNSKLFLEHIFRFLFCDGAS
jgi:hypothetical protein